MRHSAVGLIPPIEQRQLNSEERAGGVHATRFLAMGSPCEILVATADAAAAGEMARAAAAEAWRIERKFSRYRPDSVVGRLNASAGRALAVDAETRGLLDYAAHCHALSGGLFDVTSGVLRRAWVFDGSDRVPEPERIDALRPLVDFARVQRLGDSVLLPAGMEIDLGGIAKEYAVDRTLEALRGAALPVLVNYGGDLRANAPPGHQPWQVGVEDPRAGVPPAMVLELTSGALATSGDTHRFLQRGTVRYPHVLDPRTGWPVVDAPRSVTVAAATCIEAGTLSTIAMLQGPGAESFLDELGVRYWCIR